MLQRAQEQTRELLEHEAISRETAYLCAAMVAGVTFCTPLLVEYRGVLRRLGTSAEKLNDLWSNASSEHYDPGQRATLAAAVALSREPRALPPTIWASLREHCTPEVIEQVLCIIGAVNGLARIRNALDSRPGESA